MHKAISLMYHEVVEERAFDASERDANLYNLEHAEFERHLSAIAEAAGGGAPGLVEEFWEESRGGRIPVYLTFDDGGAGACRAAGLLERRGWRGHFFLATNWIGKPGFLTADQVRGLRRKGHAVGSHSCSHPLRMRELAWKSLVREWSESVEIISGILGERVRMASVPSGSYTVKVGRAAARAGIRVLFTSEPTAAAGMVDGCLVLGRYVVTRRTSPGEAAALARGDFWPCYRQALCWKAKKAAKITAGGLYERLRAAAFRWGAAG